MGLGETNDKRNSGSGHTTRLKRTDTSSRIENNNIGRQPAIIEKDNVDVYTKVVEYEKNEALGIENGKDLKLFKKTCSAFKDVIENVTRLMLNPNKSQKDVSDINSYRIDGFVYFARMKKLNRLEKFRLHHAREKLSEAKRKVDVSHLQWQNLLYETHHLKREITKCLSFKSKDEHLQLVPIDEFYRKAPQSITNVEVTQKDEHKLRLARLEWELDERKSLAEKYENLEKSKETLSQVIRKKKERLDNLVPMIKNILTVTKPVQEHLGLAQSQIQIESELTQILPPALYFLTIQASALREAYDSSLSQSILGDKNAAIRVNSHISDDVDDEESESEEETKSHHRRKSKLQIRQEKIRKLLLKHPLTVELRIQLDDENVIFISFNYLVNLKVVTVMPKMLEMTFTGICCKTILDWRNLLNGVYENDFGDKSPNTANIYQLQKLNVEFSTHELGIPYMWAQKLCGLDFIGMPQDLEKNAQQRNMSATVKRIREHVLMLIDLAEQMNDLEKLSMPMKHRDITNLPVKISCSLTKWEMLSYEQLPTFLNVSQFINNSESIDYDKYFLAVFIRNAAKLTAAILIQPSYPNAIPVFTLFIENNDRQYSAENNSDVRDMEKEINYYTEEIINRLHTKESWILTAQLYKLAVCFDIFLESTDADNFPREKLFYHKSRGRIRTLPFKCIRHENDGIFIQR